MAATHAATARPPPAFGAHARSTLWVAPGNAILSADVDDAGLRRRSLRMSGRDTWNPSQYERFRTEREQPYHDLVALITKRPAGRVVDLGCGTGVLTTALHRELQATETLGIDSSDAMLERARTPEAA